MITPKSSQKDYASKGVKKYGDMALIYGAIHSPVFQEIFKGSDNMLFLLVKQWLHFVIASIAYSMSAVFRYRFGVQSCGIVLSLTTLTFACIFNTIHIISIQKPFAIFMLPFVLYGRTPDEFYQWIVIDIYSERLLLFMLVVAALSVIHVTVAYVGGGHSDVSKRGVSWIYTILVWMFSKLRWIKINPFFIGCVIEPAIVIGCGVAIWTYWQDTYFAIWCWMMGGCELWQQLVDKSTSLHQQSILRA
uniref:Uncharacterized protein n=1 Tax=Roseihalotalea indica TaxID=2867963 RepID=A0AA49GGX9_9BACT|nr:hypothetical protein K4G66_18510 [Tunicatimonas sp. TK19036]